MLWIDIKFANMIGAKLDAFKIKGNHPYIANYRCPLCDDIKEKKRARGYFLEKKGSIFSYCHNCGASMSLINFISLIDARLSQEYRLETLKEKWGKEKPDSEIKFSQPIFKHELSLGLPLSSPISSIGHEYAIKRKIPSKFYNSIYFNENINNLTSQIEKYKTISFSNEPVIIIPFYDKNRKFSYINCRSILPTASFRYYVLEINDQLPKIWGLEFIDWNQPLFVFEGPIDAMSIPNSIAMAGVSGSNAVSYLIEHQKRKTSICFVYDSDSLYNKEINKQVKKRINQGFSVVVFDKTFPGKDINEVICNESMNENEVLQYLKKRTFSGLRAQIELSHQTNMIYA